MYTWREEENYKSRKSHKNMPSFSSTLLDEIYRSIDGNAEKPEDFKAYKEKPVKRQSESGDAASFRRACKWMEKETIEKDNDLLFFSSTSSSSDSSGALSSSDTEFFGNPTTKPKVSCFFTRPKPVRTGVPDRKNNPQQDPFSRDVHKDDHKNKVEDDLIKSKFRALKIYANLKKVKQPISPGGRLTSFINSLFNNANGKKAKHVDTNKGLQDLKSPKASSTCSSASSFSRSCLSKYSPKSREKMRNGTQRTVRFHPVSVIVDEDSRPCGHKCIYDEDSDKYKRPPLPPKELKFRNVEEAAQNALKGYYGKKSDDFSVFRKIRDEDEDDDDDGMSDSSSDLFELDLDHLALFGNNRYCEELPVYETTNLDTNRAIASRLIR